MTVRNVRHPVLTGLLCLLAAPLLAIAEPTPEELEQNRRKLEEWRKVPEQMQRLRKEAKAFFDLPEEQRKRILSIERGLYNEIPAEQARLQNVMDRYADWLDKLDDKDRARVKEAPDAKTRLALIRELRDQEWMRYQPKAHRDQVAELKGEARVELIKKLRQEERKRRFEWQIASRFWKELENKVALPTRLTDFGNDVNIYVSEYLRPMLSKEEKDRLDKAQGQWPLFPLTLVELADKHPPALPGAHGPKTFAELPAEVQKRVKLKGLPFKKLRAFEGQWPAFATELVKQHITIAQATKNAPAPFPYELWAWNRSCLSPAMQEFEDRLFKMLDIDGKHRLTGAEGKWPDFPVALQELARKHNLQPPWQSLPSNQRERWDNYRNLKTSTLAD